MENDKIEKLECDIFVDFQTLDKISRILTCLEMWDTIKVSRYKIQFCAKMNTSTISHLDFFPHEIL